jgi:hypothetical protein
LYFDVKLQAPCLKKWTSVLILFISIVGLAGSLLAQEQVSNFFDANTFYGTNDIWHEKDGKFRFISREETGEVYVIEVQEDSSLDTLLSINEMNTSRTLFSKQVRRYYYEVYLDKIVRIDLETLETELLPASDVFTQGNPTLRLSDHYFYAIKYGSTSYIKNDNYTFKSVDFVMPTLGFLNNENTFIRYEYIGDGLSKIEFVDLENFEVIELGQLENPRHEFLTDRGIILSSDHKDFYYYDEINESMILIYSLPDDHEFRRIKYHNNHIIIASLKDTVEHIVASDNYFLGIKQFEYINPEDNSNSISDLIFISDDSLLVNYNYRTLVLAVSNVDTVEIINSYISAEQVMYNDSVVAFIDDGKLFDLDLKTMDFIYRDSIEYSKKVSFSSGYFMRDYILTDSTHYFRLTSECYVSPSENQTLIPFDTDAILYNSGLKYETFFKMLDEIFIVKDDSLAVFDGSQFSVIPDVILSNDLAYFNDRAYIPSYKFQNQRFFKLTNIDNGLMISTIDSLSDLQYINKSEDGNYMIARAHPEYYYTTSNNEDFILCENIGEDFLFHEGIYFGSTTIFTRAIGVKDIYYSYNIYDQQLDSITSGYILQELKMPDGSGLLLVATGEDYQIFEYDEGLREFKKIPNGLDNYSYLGYLGPCGDQFLYRAQDFEGEDYLLRTAKDHANPDILFDSRTQTNYRYLSGMFPFEENYYYSIADTNFQYTAIKLDCENATISSLDYPKTNFLINYFTINNSLFGHFWDLNTRTIDFKKVDRTTDALEHIVSYTRDNPMSFYINPPYSIYEKAPIVFEDKAFVPMNPEIYGEELYSVKEDGSYELLFDLNPGPASSEISTIGFIGNYLYNEGYLYFTGYKYGKGRQIWRFPVEGVVSTAIKNIDEELLTLRLSPNPSSDYLQMDSDDVNKRDVKFTIFDITGKIHRRGNGIQNRVDISSLPGGMYIVLLKDKNIEVSGKFVKN